MELDERVQNGESQDPSWGEKASMGALAITVAGVALTILLAIVAVPMVVIANQISSTSGGGAQGSEPPASLPGEEVALNAGCLACHSTDGTELAGPTWAGLAGSERTLDSGEVVIADDDYLKTAIVDPAAEVVEGYNPIMPADFGDRLSDDEIDDLIEYINSLS